MKDSPEEIRQGVRVQILDCLRFLADDNLAGRVHTDPREDLELVATIEEGFFIFKIWEGEFLYRSLTLSGLGYSGMLNIRVKDCSAARAIGLDVLAMVACKPGAIAIALAPG